MLKKWLRKMSDKEAAEFKAVEDYHQMMKSYYWMGIIDKETFDWELEMLAARLDVLEERYN